MSDSIFLRTSSLLGPYKHITDFTQQNHNPIICQENNLVCNSDIFNLHVVPMNLPVETANEETHTVITVATDLWHGAEESSNFTRSFCNWYVPYVNKILCTSPVHDPVFVVLTDIPMNYIKLYHQTITWVPYLCKHKPNIFSKFASSKTGMWLILGTVLMIRQLVSRLIRSVALFDTVKQRK